MKCWAIYTNLPVHVIVRLPYIRSGESQGHETLLARSADRKTCNYDIGCSNHHPSLSSLRPKGLSSSKMKWWAIHTSLPVDAIERLPYPPSGESQIKETFLAPSAEKPTGNHDIECSKHHPWLSTLRPKGLSCRKIKWWDLYTNLPVDVIVRLPHPRKGDSQNQETVLARSVEKPTCNYDIECSNHYPSLSTPSPKGLSRSNMKLWVIYKNLTVDVIVRLPHPQIGNSQGQETFSAPSAEKQTRNYDIECSNHHMYISFYDTDPQARNICCTQK